MEERKGGDDDEGAEESKGGDAPSAPPAPASPTRRAPKREKLTPFLAEVEAALLTLHRQNHTTDAPAPSSAGGGSDSAQLLALATAGVDKAVARFLRAVEDVAASGSPSQAALTSALAALADDGLPPYVGSAVNLLATVQRNAVSSLTTPKDAAVEGDAAAAPVVGKKRGKLGPMEQVARYTSVNQGWGNGSMVCVLLGECGACEASVGVCLAGSCSACAQNHGLVKPACSLVLRTPLLLSYSYV